MIVIVADPFRLIQHDGKGSRRYEYVYDLFAVRDHFVPVKGGRAVFVFRGENAANLYALTFGRVQVRLSLRHRKFEGELHFLAALVALAVAHGDQLV